ncbi:MAG: DUF2232 domain-containing protein [Ahrensia sp.]|nr:DUF2232 domain-containing protein [Ahrensia sp.]
MKFDLNNILVGVLAGAATAILCLGMASGSGLSVLLYLLSAVPIMTAGLGWGLGASVIGVAVAALSVILIANQQTALFVVLTTALPAALSAHWLTLSRPADEIGGKQGSLAWFPLSDVMLRLCIIIGGAFIVIGIMVNYSQELMQPVLDELVARLQENNPEFSFTPEARTQFDGAMLGLMPFFQPFLWVLVLIANLYIALRVTFASGQLKRPREDFPQGMRMPKIALIPFGIAILGTMMSGNIGLAATALAGALSGGFMLSGFAFFHDYSRAKPWRGLAMALVYISTAITMLPPFLMFFLGLFSVARNIPTSSPSNPPKNSNT